MNENLELKLKVTELEKRIKFLYRTMEKQAEINAKLIDHIKDLQTSIKSCSDASQFNSESILLLSAIIQLQNES